MGSFNASKEKRKEIKAFSLDKCKSLLQDIKSKYIITKIFDNLQKNKFLNIIKYNKKLQKIINIDKKDYEEYLKIEIEIIPVKDKEGKFINKMKDYHIYFNEHEEEINRNYLTKDDNVSKIKIILEPIVKSFEKLFNDCKIIKSINFKKFDRNNIQNMSYMFCGCSSLEELNLSNINTNNATNMHGMFFGCSSLKELYVSNFNTNNVTDMHGMFFECSSLKELDLSNFNSNNVTNMSYMFFRCSSLIELNITNFNINKVIYMNRMFSGCSEELKLKIKSLNKFNEETFY